MRCPRCGGDVEIFFLAPGDKAARCRYCGTVVDLPDDDRTELSEEEVRPDGTRIVRRVVSTKTDGSAGLPGSLSEQVHAALEQASRDRPEHAERIQQALAKLESGQASVQVVSQFSANSTSVHGSAGLAALPADLREQVAEFFGNAAPEPTATSVTVKWSDGRVYSGILIRQQGGDCLIQFNDGSRRWIPSSAVEFG